MFPARRRLLLFAFPDPRPAARGNGQVVLHIVDARNPPDDFTDVMLEPFVLDETGERDAAAFNPDLHFAGARQQLECVVEEVLEFRIVGRPERLAAANRDGRKQRGTP